MKAGRAGFGGGDAAAKHSKRSSSFGFRRIAEIRRDGGRASGFDFGTIANNCSGNEE
jgi:hypothetical protein